MYFIYIVRCLDNSLYTGITSDIKKRISEHYYQKKQCAKYTKSHKVVELSAVWSAIDKSSALKCESRIKKLPKEEKEKLILNGCDFEECTRVKNISIEDCI